GILLWSIVAAALIWLPKRQATDAGPPPEPLKVGSADAVSEKSDAANTSHETQPSITLQTAWDPKGVKEFAFTDQSGKKVTKADLLGHPWLVCFIFTRCAGPCPKVSEQMAELQRVVKGTKVRLVS